MTRQALLDLAALKAAENVLCEYACHLGPDTPCRRSADQCLDSCGKEAGDALVLIHRALAQEIEP